MQKLSNPSAEDLAAIQEKAGEYGSGLADKQAEARQPEHSMARKGKPAEKFPVVSWKEMGVTQHLSSRFLLHGIESPSGLPDLEINENNFEDVCKLVCTEEPYKVGTSSRVEAFLLKHLFSNLKGTGPGH